MAMSSLVRSYESREQQSSLGPSLAFLVAVAATVAVAVIAARALHWDYVLPLISTALFILAAIAAALGWRRRKGQQASLTYWDVAGAMTLIGIFAAALVEPEQLMRVLTDTRTH